MRRFKPVENEHKKWRAKGYWYKVKVYSDSSTLNRGNFTFLGNCVWVVQNAIYEFALCRYLPTHRLTQSINLYL